MRRDIFSVQKDVINQRIELKNLPFWNNVAMGLHRYALKTVDSKNLLIHPLRLKGGGESSISNGTSAWGTSPLQSSNHNSGKKIVLPHARAHTYKKSYKKER